MQRKMYKMRLSELKRLISEETTKSLSEKTRLLPMDVRLSDEEAQANLKQNLSSLGRVINNISGPGSDALEDVKSALVKFVSDLKSKEKLSKDDVEKINNVFNMFSVTPTVVNDVVKKYKSGLEELAGEAGYLIKYLDRGQSVGKRGGILGKLFKKDKTIEVPDEIEIKKRLKTSGQFASEKDMDDAASSIQHSLKLFSKTLPGMRNEIESGLKSGLSSKFPAGVTPEILAGNLLDVVLRVDFEGGMGVTELPTKRSKGGAALMYPGLSESTQKLKKRRLNEDLKMLSALLNKISIATGGDETIELGAEDIEEIPSSRPEPDVKASQTAKSLEVPKAATEKPPEEQTKLESDEQKLIRLITAKTRSPEDKEFIKKALLSSLFSNRILLKMALPKNLKHMVGFVLALKDDLGIK